MRRFWQGAALLGGLYAALALLALVLSHNSAAMALLRPIGRLMQGPVQPVFAAFRLHDDDPRVLYPILVSSLLWGLVGGVTAVAWGRIRRAFGGW